MSELARWMAARRPHVPEPLRSRLASAVGGHEGVASLGELGLRGLEGVDASRQLDREAAYELLAADAFITYACEAATEADDVEAALALVVDRISAAGR